MHGFTSGADNTNLAVQWVALTGGLLVFLLVSFRVLAPRRSARAAAATRTRAARASADAERATGTRAAASEPDAAALRGRSAQTAAKVAELAEMVEAARSAGHGATD